MDRHGCLNVIAASRLVPFPVPYDWKKHKKKAVLGQRELNRIEKMLYAKCMALEKRVTALEGGETLSEKRARLVIEEEEKKRALVQDLKQRKTSRMNEQFSKEERFGSQSGTLDLDPEKKDSTASTRWLAKEVDK